MRFYSGLCLGICCLILLGGCGSAGSQPESVQKIQSVTLDARNKPSEHILPSLQKLGVTHITLIQFGYQREAEVPQIRMQTDAHWYSESDRGIREFAQAADSLGIKIILKPHLWLGRYSVEGQTRSTIGYDSEEEWQTWESQYTTLISHYAHLAEEIQAPMLVIGTELARSVRERPQYWRTLIEDVRKVYGGQLTYAANWWEEYEHITFWDALDFIGIQGYFELSLVPNPTLAQISEGWAKHKRTMQRLSESTNKPVLFTEIGYRNVPDAAAKPWRWPSREEIGRTEPDNTLQARLYQSFFDNLWHEPWFEGAILWKWRGDHDRRRNYLDFSPQGKPAEEVIRQWFADSYFDQSANQ